MSQLSLLEGRLPNRPYCTDDLSCGVKILGIAQALEKAYIQPNPPALHYWLVFDVDRPGSAIDWESCDIAAPNFSIENPKNGHAHLWYGIKAPVCKTEKAQIKPLKLLAAIEQAMCEQLGADRSYAGLISKNPIHGSWRTLHWHSDLYELNELADHLDLSRNKAAKKPIEARGLGRNVMLFETLAKWSYRAIRQGWPSYDRWLEACLSRAEMINAGFHDALPLSEIKATAKSVAKWTYKHFSPEGFRAWQAEQGAKGGKAKGKAYADKRQEAIELRALGLSLREIASRIGCSKSSVSNWVSK